MAAVKYSKRRVEATMTTKWIAIQQLHHYLPKLDDSCKEIADWNGVIRSGYFWKEYAESVRRMIIDKAISAKNTRLDRECAHLVIELECISDAFNEPDDLPLEVTIQPEDVERIKACSKKLSIAIQRYEEAPMEKTEFVMRCLLVLDEIKSNKLKDISGDPRAFHVFNKLWRRDNDKTSKVVSDVQKDALQTFWYQLENFDANPELILTGDTMYETDWEHIKIQAESCFNIVMEDELRDDQLCLIKPRTCTFSSLCHRQLILF